MRQGPSWSAVHGNWHRLRLFPPVGLVYHVRSSGLDVVGSTSVTQASGQTWQVDRGAAVDRGVTGRCGDPGFPGGNPGIMDGSDEGLQSALFTARTAFEAFTTALARYALFSAYCADRASRRRRSAQVSTFQARLPPHLRGMKRVDSIDSTLCTGQPGGVTAVCRVCAS